MSSIERTSRFWRSRARQRGTALMEALIVNMALITLFAGVTFFHSAYSAKIRSDQNTRVYAWAWASHNCVADDKHPLTNETMGIEEAAGAPSHGDESEGDDPKGDLENAGQTIPSGGKKLENDDSYTKNVFGSSSVGSVSAKSTTTVGGFGAIAGLQVSSTTHVQCNLVPEDTSNMVEVGIQAAKGFANW